MTAAFERNPGHSLRTRINPLYTTNASAKNTSGQNRPLGASLQLTEALGRLCRYRALLNTSCCPHGNELNILTESLQGDSIVKENLSAQPALPNYEPMAFKMPKISIIRSFTCNSSWVWTISLTKLQIPQCCAKWSHKDDGQALHTALSYFTYRHFFYALYFAARSGCSFNIVNTTCTKSQFIPEAFFPSDSLGIPVYGKNIKISGITNHCFTTWSSVL